MRKVCLRQYVRDMYVPGSPTMPTEVTIRWDTYHRKPHLKGVWETGGLNHSYRTLSISMTYIVYDRS